MNNSVACVNGPYGEIKAIICDSEPWFCASDVCNALRLPDFNEAFYRLDRSMRDWKCLTLGVPVSVPVVNSDGLYALYLSGKDPETRYFRDALLEGLFPMMGLSNSDIASRFRLADAKVIPPESALQQTDTSLQVFSDSRFGKVRVVMRNGEPWFVAKDVCDALDIGNPSQALTRLDDDEKMTLITNDSHSGQRGGAQSMSFVNEYGLYSLILTSRKPEAKAFKRWITHEVIPSIRKHGGYMLGQGNNGPTLNTNDVSQLTETLQQVKGLLAELSDTVFQLKNANPESKVKTTSDEDSDLLTVTTIAKEFGYSAVLLNKYLFEKGIQTRQHGIWELCPQYAKFGYARAKEIHAIKADGCVTKYHLYWTPKGRQFIHELLKDDGIFPV